MKRGSDYAIVNQEQAWTISHWFAPTVEMYHLKLKSTEMAAPSAEPHK